MGTRSLTVFEDHKQEICVLYRHMDGYPTGHGADLKDFLKAFRVVNGLASGRSRIANGMDCLAAQVVAHFKKEPGSFYLQPAGTRDCGEEFIYTLYCPNKTGPVHLKVQAGVTTYFGLPGTKQHNMPVLFDGPIAKFNPQKAEQLYHELRAKIPNDYLESKKGEAH
jgi:hypothetical protein